MDLIYVGILVRFGYVFHLGEIWQFMIFKEFDQYI